MKDLISIRAELRRQIVETRRKYLAKEKASHTDDDSDSYDEMQRLGGQLSGLEYAHETVKQMIAKKRRGKK